MKFIPQTIFLPLFSLALLGCGQEEISIYKIPKENLSNSASALDSSQNLPPDHPPISEQAGSPIPLHHAGELHWNPSGEWVEKPASGMRQASYVLEGTKGLTADISVVSLGGQAGGLLANVNRWRGQLELPPTNGKTLKTQSEKIMTRAGPVTLVDIVSSKNLIQDQYKKRLLTGILERNDKTWFFKMMGEDSLVRNAKPSFIQFLKSIHEPHS